ncbi:hypothetical protein [Flavobacterium sp.]|uniref:hypothetical protein n=1 Tax=Flavobacterium sp. TaxID=239 RepID=UPI00374DA7CB
MYNNKPTKETQNEWRNNPNYWIWGFFYFNPKDIRLFPPKRIKELGWTINFAHPNSVVMFIFIIAIILIIR